MRIKTLLSVCVLAVLGVPVQAQNPYLTVEQKAFLEVYIGVHEAQDFEEYKSLIHPASRQCFGEAFLAFTQKSFEDRAQELKSYTISDQRILPLEVQTYQNDVERQFRNQAYIPVEPEYHFQIGLKQRMQDQNICDAQLGEKTMDIVAKFEQNRWYEVLPCAKSGFDEVMEHNLDGIERQKERVQALYDEVPVDLWVELNTVLRDQKDRVKATKIVQQETGLSALKAASVIDYRCEIMTKEH